MSISDYKNAIEAYLNEPYVTIQKSNQTKTSPKEDDKFKSYWDSILVKKRGLSYKTSVKWSHLREKIDSHPDFSGKSRVWGDVILKNQANVVNLTVKLLRDSTGDNIEFQSIVMSIMRLESGFNVDACAGTTSAAGLGQFIDATWISTLPGNSVANRWDTQDQINSLIALSARGAKTAISKGWDETYIYVLHYAGQGATPSNPNFTKGLSLSKSKIIPMAKKIKPLLEKYESYKHF